ncbi:MAG TPA: branched-chain amino acid ABC transporter permease, partial [Rhodoblastus sp.]|nr:branched-chain amino acid ABC transporter permease [Rhodoblastus sp.]
GAVIAGVLYRVMPALFSNWGINSDLTLVIFGAALLHAIMTAPDGLSGQILQAFGKVTRRA